MEQDRGTVIVPDMVTCATGEMAGEYYLRCCPAFLIPEIHDRFRLRDRDFTDQSDE